MAQAVVAYWEGRGWSGGVAGDLDHWGPIDDVNGTAMVQSGWRMKVSPFSAIAWRYGFDPRVSYR